MAAQVDTDYCQIDPKLNILIWCNKPQCSDLAQPDMKLNILFKYLPEKLKKWQNWNFHADIF